MPIALDYQVIERFCPKCGENTEHTRYSAHGKRMNMRPGSLSYPKLFPWLVLPYIIYAAHKKYGRML